MIKNLAVGNAAHRARVERMTGRFKKPEDSRPPHMMPDGKKILFWEISDRTSSHKTGWWVPMGRLPEKGKYRRPFRPDPCHFYILNVLSLDNELLNTEEIQARIKDWHGKDFSIITIRSELSSLCRRNPRLERWNIKISTPSYRNKAGRNRSWTNIYWRYKREEELGGTDPLDN